MYKNWGADANASNRSPSVSLSFQNGRRSIKGLGLGCLEDRVNQDLRLFSTPAASLSRSSGSVSPTTNSNLNLNPPPLVDLVDEEENDKVKVIMLILNILLITLFKSLSSYTGR